MANNNTETKYVKWNTLIAIAAIITSTFISMYTINKQNDFWEHQNAIKNKEQYNQIRIQKIEDIDKAFNQFFQLYQRKVIIRNAILPRIKGIASASMDVTGDLMGRIITDTEIITELRVNLIFHLETLKPFFSDDIVNNAKELEAIS